MEQPQQQEPARRPRAVRQGEQLPPQRCPRCDSSNTKFCYFNNYSSSQPRYFCKTCRRYWTQGGTLRNVPHGGCTSRKGKRSKKPSSSSTDAAAIASVSPTIIVPTTTNNNNINPPDLPHELQLDDNLDPSANAAAAAASAMAFGPDAAAIPPSVYYGVGRVLAGGMGVRPFVPGAMIGDLGGVFPTESATMLPPFDPQFLYGFNLPPTQQQQFIPLNPNLIPQPGPQPGISQHGWLHNFASTNATGTMPNAAAAALANSGGGDAAEAYWNNVVTGESSGRWGPDLSSRVPHPPSPPPFI